MKITKFSLRMRNPHLFTFLAFLLLFSPSCGIEELFEVKFIDRVVVTDVDLSAWDLFTDPDLQLSYGINSPGMESEIIQDVSNSDIPLEFLLNDRLELTNDNWVIKIVDVDNLSANDVLIEAKFLGLDKTEEGNPFILSNENITLEVFWKIQ